MASESETFRLTDHDRIVRIEERLGQLLRDHSTLVSTVENLRGLITILKEYKVKVETQVKTTLWLIGLFITLANIAVQIAFKIFSH